MNDTRTNRTKLARQIRRVNKDLGIPSSKTSTMIHTYSVSELAEMLERKNIALNYKIRKDYCG